MDANQQRREIDKAWVGVGVSEYNAWRWQKAGDAEREAFYRRQYAYWANRYKTLTHTDWISDELPAVIEPGAAAIADQTTVLSSEEFDKLKFPQP